MGVPNSEVGYTSAMPRREDHEVHKRTCGGTGQKKNIVDSSTIHTERIVAFTLYRWLCERAKVLRYTYSAYLLYRGADKSLARPGRKQATFPAF